MTEVLLGDWAVAVHESGHTVAEWWVGFQILEVSLEPARVREAARRRGVAISGEDNGIATFMYGAQSSNPVLEMMVSFVYVCGPLAEAYIVGISQERRRELLRSEDLTRAIPASDVLTLAREFVIQEHRRILTVASALVRERTMFGRRVNEILKATR